MKPFNLKEALEGKPVITRCGLKVNEIYHSTKLDQGERLFVVVDGMFHFYYVDGTFSENRQHSGLDLFMSEEKIQEIYVNCYLIKGNLRLGSQHYNTELIAKENIIVDPLFEYLKTIKITTEI